MKPINEMSREEIRLAIRATAWGLARLAYRRGHPTSSPSEADAWADQNWQEFEEKAVDFLALVEARREKEVEAEK